jgi:hypothetical protein
VLTIPLHGGQNPADSQGNRSSVDAYRRAERHRRRVVRERDFWDAINARDCDFANALAVYEQLPYREWRVPGYGRDVLIARRCSVMDVIASIHPGEGRLGPWRIVLRGKTVGLGLDDWVKFPPDLERADRSRLVKAGVIYY